MRVIQFLFICCLVACAPTESEPMSREPYTTQETERFVREQLMNDQGELRTNRTDRKDEYLSESLGLWMMYLVRIGDETSFERLHETVHRWMTKEGAVYWQRDGQVWKQATASIDDLRIAYAYLCAFEKWEKDEYYTFGEKIVHHFSKYQVKNGKFSDFYDLTMNKEGNTQTTSYYNEHALRAFAQHGWLESTVVERWVEGRKEEPTDGTMYPPTRFLIEEEQYEFDEEINGIDIAYTLLYRADWTSRERQLYDAWREQFMTESRLTGRISRSNHPLVTFESPAQYALLGLVALRQEDQRFAEQLYAKLRSMQSTMPGYEGQFVDEKTGDLHVFDHVLFLIFEQEVAYDNVE